MFLEDGHAWPSYYTISVVLKICLCNFRHSSLSQPLCVPYLLLALWRCSMSQILIVRSSPLSLVQIYVSLVLGVILTPCFNVPISWACVVIPQTFFGIISTVLSPLKKNSNGFTFFGITFSPKHFYFFFRPSDYPDGWDNNRWVIKNIF